MTKYRHWYDRIVDRAQNREIPKCYTEVHHIEPRSMGGSDDPSNLVRLTYREHFLVHWLLTKFTAGGDLRKMQRAMFAMTLKVSGERITAGWQFEAAKRAIRDLESDPALEAEWRARYEAARIAKREAVKVAAMQDMIDKAGRKKRILADLESNSSLERATLNDLASEFLRSHKRHPRHPRKGGGRKGPFVDLFPQASREDRVRQAQSIINSVSAD